MKGKDSLVWLPIAVFSGIYAFMSVVKHNAFQTFGWDLAVFDHGIWQWSQFRLPYSSFHDLPWLADHFHLILVTAAPFYWIWPDVRVILILQAVLVSLGALPLYILGKKVTKNTFFSFTVVLGYLLFYSSQSFVFSDFHELAFLPITFGGVLLFWELRKKLFYWVFFVLALLVKEEVGLLLFAFGIWAIINDKQRYKQALLSAVLGLVYTFSMVYIIMPAIGGASYRHLGFGQSGENVHNVILTALLNPLYLARAFMDSPVKINTMVNTFWPWGFLPFFSPASLILILEQFASRFLDYGKPIRWTLTLAYSLPMVVICAWGSIYGFNNLIKTLQRISKLSKNSLGLMISLILLSAITLSDLLLHGPINNIFKPQFYYKESWVNDNLNVLKCIPKDASVSAQNSLAPHISERDKIKIFPEGIGLDYIVLDLHPGQSENSFHFLGSKNTKIIMDDLLVKGYYKIICQESLSLALKKEVNPPYNLHYPFAINIEEK